jgi:RimJ/RimL family protein N-acetyltransferase
MRYTKMSNKCDFVIAGNTRSTTLLRKLGFIYEGKLHQRHIFHGHVEDEQYFGLLKDE